MELDLFGTKRRQRELQALRSTMERQTAELTAARNDLNWALSALADDRGVTGDADKTQKPKSTYRGTDVPRAKMSDLEGLYAADYVVYAGVNIGSSLAASVNHTLRCEVKEDEAPAQELLDRLRFEDWVRTFAAHQFLYGEYWGEVLLNETGKMVSDVRTCDPKSMDFEQHEDQGHLYYDLGPGGRPKGYIQYPYDWDGSLDNRDITHFKAEQIIHAPMRTIADSLRGLGVVEVIRKPTLAKMNIEEALAEAIYRIGFPLYVQYCGDKEHDPSRPVLAAAHQDVKKLNNKSVVTLPYYRKLDTLSPTIVQIRENLDHYLNAQVAGFGIAKAIILGIGEGTNRATLDQLTAVGASNIRSIHRSVTNYTYEKLFLRGKQLGQFKGKVWVEFDPVKWVDKAQTAQLVVDLVTAGVITPEAELEDWVRSFLELPDRKGEYAPKEAAAPGAAFSNSLLDYTRRT